MNQHLVEDVQVKMYLVVLIGACNYNVDANVDDDSCTYPTQCADCTVFLTTLMAMV